ncbi:MAG TPA: hypothetical protein VK698_38895 [Kofleriaceae bacterium]|nr:hypothetical protein [Kofleriaceae bacterium]
MGAERIALVAGDQRVDLLVRRRPDQDLGAEVFSQRVFLVSPGGRHLVHATADRALRVRGERREHVIDRAGERDVRFSADGRRMAALQESGSGGMSTVVLLDLDRDVERPLGQVYWPRWMEWVERGVVVAHLDVASKRPTLTYFPLDGQPRVLVSREGIEARFTAASRGTRVMFFGGPADHRRIYTVEVDGGEPRVVGTLPDPAWNVEMAPDGREAAIVTHGALHRWTAGGPLEQLDRGRIIHTVWYSPDGAALAYASSERATVLLPGGVRRDLDAPGGDLRALRFRRDGEGLVAVRGDTALAWLPATGEIRVLAAARPGETLQGADVYRGGVVLWTSSSGDGPPTTTAPTTTAPAASPPTASPPAQRASAARAQASPG